MSVRPITISEEIKAKGHPFVNIFSVFGGLQGLLIFLNRQRIPITENWFSHPGSLGRFAFLVLGGYAVGGLVAMIAFTDMKTLRLYRTHTQDRILNVEGQRADNF